VHGSTNKQKLELSKLIKMILDGMFLVIGVYLGVFCLLVYRVYSMNLLIDYDVQLEDSDTNLGRAALVCHPSAFTVPSLSNLSIVIS